MVFDSEVPIQSVEGVGVWLSWLPVEVEMNVALVQRDSNSGTVRPASSLPGRQVDSSIANDLNGCLAILGRNSPDVVAHEEGMELGRPVLTQLKPPDIAIERIAFGDRDDDVWF